MELVHGLLLDAGDELVGEVFASRVEDFCLRVLPGDPLADGVEQMGLAQSRVAVDEQRVVRLARRVGDGQGRGVRKGVGVTDDERFKGEFVVHHGMRRFRLDLFFGLGRCIALLPFRDDLYVDGKAHVLFKGVVQQVLELAADDVRLELRGGQNHLVVLEGHQLQGLQPEAVDGLGDMLFAVLPDQFPDVVIGVHNNPHFHLLQLI